MEQKDGRENKNKSNQNKTNFNNFVKPLGQSFLKFNLPGVEGTQKVDF